MFIHIYLYIYIYMYICIYIYIMYKHKQHTLTMCVFHEQKPKIADQGLRRRGAKRNK